MDVVVSRGVVLVLLVMAGPACLPPLLPEPPVACVDCCEEPQTVWGEVRVLDADDDFTLGPAVSLDVDVRGLALADMDGDGSLDVVTAPLTGGTVQWVKDLGGAREVVSSAVGLGASWSSVLVPVALDGEGALDLVVLLENQFDVLQQGPGGFTRTFTGSVSNPVSFAVLDVTRDGLVDVVAFRHRGGTDVWRQEHAGSFVRSPALDTPATTTSPGMAAFDATGDGIDDVVVVLGNPSRILLLAGKAEGGLKAAVDVLPAGDFELSGSPFADVTGDGLTDVLVVDNVANEVHVLAADGAGGFSAPSLLGRWTEPGCADPDSCGWLRGLTAGDVTGDGLVDVVGRLDDAYWIGSNDGQGGLDTRALVEWPQGAGLALGDLDDDGALEVVVGGGNPPCTGEGL